jgi:hypothetical protein
MMSLLSLASLTAFLGLGALGQEAARFGVFDIQPSTVKVDQVRRRRHKLEALCDLAD